MARLGFFLVEPTVGLATRSAEPTRPSELGFLRSEHRVRGWHELVEFTRQYPSRRSRTRLNASVLLLARRLDLAAPPARRDDRQPRRRPVRILAALATLLSPDTSAGADHYDVLTPCRTPS